MVGAPRPRSPKQTDKKFNYAAGKNEDWNTVSNAVTALFQRKKLTKFELSSLMEKVKTVKQEINGPAICERFKESLVKGMIILREDVKPRMAKFFWTNWQIVGLIFSALYCLSFRPFF